MPPESSTSRRAPPARAADSTARWLSPSSSSSPRGHDLLHHRLLRVVLGAEPVAGLVAGGAGVDAVVAGRRLAPRLRRDHGQLAGPGLLVFAKDVEIITLPLKPLIH